jgi:hypothetical protein
MNVVEQTKQNALAAAHEHSKQEAANALEIEKWQIERPKWEASVRLARKVLKSASNAALREIAAEGHASPERNAAQDLLDKRAAKLVRTDAAVKAASDCRLHLGRLVHAVDGERDNDGLLSDDEIGVVANAFWRLQEVNYRDDFAAALDEAIRVLTAIKAAKPQ